MSCAGAKYMEDHSSVVDGVRLWRCAGCQKVAPWGPTWGTYGIVECPSCGRQHVDWAACSQACAGPLLAAEKRRTPRRIAGLDPLAPGDAAERERRIDAAAAALADLTPAERAEALRRARRAA